MRSILVVVLLLWLSCSSYQGRLVVVDDDLPVCDAALARFSPLLARPIRGMVTFFPGRCGWNSSEKTPTTPPFTVWLLDSCNGSSLTNFYSVVDRGSQGALAVVYTETHFPWNAFFARKNVSVPIFSISGSVPVLIKKRIVQDKKKVEVLLDNHSADWFNCDDFPPLTVSYVVLSGLWAVAICTASLSIFSSSRNPIMEQQSSPVLRLLLILAALKFSMSCVGALMFVRCRVTRLQDHWSVLFAVSYAWIATIYAPIFFGVTLATSKGLFISRETLTRKESFTVATVMAVMLAVLICYQMDGALFMPALLFLYGGVAVVSLKACQMNIVHIGNRLEYIHENELHTFEDSFRVKLLQFRMLQWTLAVFYTCVFFSRCVLQTLLGLWATGVIVLASVDLAVWIALVAVIFSGCTSSRGCHSYALTEEDDAPLFYSSHRPPVVLMKDQQPQPQEEEQVVVVLNPSSTRLQETDELVSLHPLHNVAIGTSTVGGGASDI